MDHEPVPWRLGAPPQLDEALFESFSSRELPDGQELIGWTCPRCFQAHSESIERDGQWSGLDASDRGGAELPIKCDCKLDHSARPNGEVGCGYRKVLILGADE